MKAMIFKRELLFLFFAFAVSSCSQQQKPEIRLFYEDNRSLKHTQAIDKYKRLADYYDEAALFEMGHTDSGRPLHLFMISADGDFDPLSIRAKGKSIILINNGIHAGEPVGIDASMQYVIDLLENRGGIEGFLDNTVIAIIPVYNVGGLLNSSPFHRMNQDGPELKGARRNARNLDLNRDFVKQDSKNSRSFARIFHYLDPDIFVDTHTTNGMDHKAVMTLIPTMHQRLPDEMGAYFRNQMLPWLYERMNNDTPLGMVPYLHLLNRQDARDGILAFNDYPNYSSGYAALFDTFSFITETLVYKPYHERVRSTVEFLRFLHEYTSENNNTIRGLRDNARLNTTKSRFFVLDWEVDYTESKKVHFKGYETVEKTGAITGRVLREYDYERVWEDSIPFYDIFTPVIEIEAPEAYIIPAAWSDITERMKLNGVEVEYLENDSVIESEITYISSYTTSPVSNQGRHPVIEIETSVMVGKRQFYKGDAIIWVNQRSNKYIVNMLEARSPVSFLRWGLFTSAFESGEWFSLYAFESKAMELLDQDRELREKFNERLSVDSDFAGDPLAQLQFIYDSLPHPEIETSSNLYPVGRVL